MLQYARAAAISAAFFFAASMLIFFAPAIFHADAADIFAAFAALMLDTRCRRCAAAALLIMRCLALPPCHALLRCHCFAMLACRYRRARAFMLFLMPYAYYASMLRMRLCALFIMARCFRA